MTVNKGVAPPNYESEIGKFRATVGDTHYVELDPPQPGYGDYDLFSDGEIQVFLDTHESFEEAVGFAYLSLATSAALEAKNVKDFDLQVNTEKRAGELRALAQFWFDRDSELSADIFEVFDTVIETGRSCVPEATARPWL